MDHRAAFAELQKLCGKDLLQVAKELQITVRKQTPDGQSKLNKGWPGHTVERFLGLPLNSSKSPNLGSWELKVVPMRKRPDGALEPKETMAITMLDQYEVQLKNFPDSHLFTKLSRLIIVSRQVEPDRDSSMVLNCSRFLLDSSEHKEQIRKDYEEIRRMIGSGKPLSGKIGKLIQPRTKGSKNSSTRAFYARKELVAHMVRPSTGISADRSSNSVCTLHAGKDNGFGREELDHLMRTLPENQSGAGRHKCPYCAYQLGFRAGRNSIDSQENLFSGH